MGTSLTKELNEKRSNKATPFSMETPQAHSKQKHTRSLNDPRSPQAGRTPINLSDLSQQSLTSTPCSESTLGMLRKRFLKTFTSTTDPRSPSEGFKRTPLVFEEARERTLSLDDTFADLLIETRAPLTMTDRKPEEVPPPALLVAPDPTELTLTGLDEMDKETLAVLELIQQDFDPRSPTIGVNRTPLVFDDEDSNFLSSLSLSDISPKYISDGTPNAESKPVNKHLESVRCGRKLTKATPRREVFEDAAIRSPTQQATKKAKRSEETPDGGLKRTPLSCARNRLNFREREALEMKTTKGVNSPGGKSALIERLESK